MAHRFMHVAFHFAEKFKIQELEAVMTAIADDWIRVSALSWVLWTDKPAAHIFALLEPHLDKQNDQVLMHVFQQDVVIGADTFGYLAPWIWDWLNSKIPNFASYGPELDFVQKLPKASFNTD